MKGDTNSQSSNDRYGASRRFVVPAAAIFAFSAVSSATAHAQGADRIASYVSHGVSHELATWRAKTVSDVRYDLSLDVTALDSALGHVAIRFKRTGADDAVIDYRGRRLMHAIANGTLMQSSGTGFNGNHLRIPAGALKPGENVVELDFVSDIAPSGASIIRTHDPDGSDYLYTLLVPADANQLFPCFDQPDLKAQVTFALTSPRAWTALANGTVARADTNGNRVDTHFVETRPLSTYLIAFAAGPWKHATSTVAGRTIHAYFRKSRAKEVDADSLLLLTHRAITWMEQYFGRSYPFEKFDLMLSPAFPFGGMEHPGLVMFNEDRFIFRERPTLPRRLGRFSTILHEVAHQWFGDLVTMRWFDDLWLKEGFATYMAAKALAELEPASDAWKVFYLGNKPTAYGVDQTTGTTPLWQELANLDQAKSAYGAIVYNKAPSVLKQLNYLVGDSVFRAGVRIFLNEHAYANATWQDLLRAIGKAGSTSLDEFGRNYMLRPGMAEVEPRLTVRDGRIAKLELVQKPAQLSVSGSAPWPIRTQVALGYEGNVVVKVPVVMTASTTEVVEARGKDAPRFMYPNDGDYGYFLSLLDSASVRALEGGAFSGVNDGFLRAMLWGALWDQVRNARMDPVRFVRLALSELPRERDEQILPNLLGRLERALRAYVPLAERETIRPEAEHLLWEGARDTRRPYGSRKGYLDAFVAVAATPDGIAKLESLLSADSAAGEPVRDPTRWEVVNRLLVLDTPGAERALGVQSAHDTTADGRRRAFIAGAARKSAAVKAEYFRRYLADSALNEDWASGSLGAFNAIEHQELSLPFLPAALHALPFIQANRRIFFLGGWLGAFLNGQTSDGALDIVHKYLADEPDLPRDLGQKVLQNADELERTVRIRKRWSTAASQDMLDARIDSFVRSEMARQKIPGVAIGIVRGDSVIKAQGYGYANLEHDAPASPVTIFQSGSLGKQFTAMAVMLQVEDGKLSLSDTITKFFPDAPDTWRSITVRHLLTHTSGIPDYTDGSLDYRKDYTEDDLARFAYTLKLEFAAGARWNYSNTGYVLLGAIVRKVSGSFYGDVLAARVFRPLGMTTTRVISEADIVPHRAAGYRLEKGETKNQEWVSPVLNTTADGSLYFSVRDLIAWNAGVRARAILKPESWNQILRPVQLNSGRTYPYGFGWALDERGGGPLHQHGGAWQGFETHFSRFVADDLSIIVLTNLAQADPARVADGIAAIIDPRLAVPPLQPIADREPEVTARLTNLLDTARGGRLVPADFAYVRAGFFPDAAKNYQEELARLGAPRRMVLVQRMELGDDRVYVYEVAFGARTMYYRVALAPDNRVSQFQLR